MFLDFDNNFIHLVFLKDDRREREGREGKGCGVYHTAISG